MKNILLFCLLLSVYVFPQKDTALTLSEVMFNAPIGDNQFVEIFNLSFTDTIDLEYYSIQYANNTPNYIINAGWGTKLAPRGYAVVYENDYYILTGRYHYVVPANALQLHISENQFGTVGMVSNANRVVSLLNKNKTVIDTYTYSADQTIAGISDEKYMPSKDNSASNWRNSISGTGTPGAKNSVTPVLYDVSVKLASGTLLPVFLSDNISLKMLVKNNSPVNAARCSLYVYEDVNLDSTAQGSELIYSSESKSITAGDSLEFTYSIKATKEGIHRFIAKVVLNYDESPADNSSTLEVQVNKKEFYYNDIVINEIMYDPPAGGDEWIELFNRSDKTINLKKWSVEDKVHKYTLPNKDVLMTPNSYLVICGDSLLQQKYGYAFNLLSITVPPLNNDGDIIAVTDSLGVVIDSIIYTPAMGGKNGYSLERRFADSSSTSLTNWTSCNSKLMATPGIANSMLPKKINFTVGDLSGDKKYYFEKDSVTVSFTIKNNGTSTASGFSVSVYDDANADSSAQANELIQTVSLNSTLNANDSLRISVTVSPLSTGKHLLIVSLDSAGDEYSYDNTSMMSVQVVKQESNYNDIVLSELMYYPLPGDAEWIEIYNRSAKAINLNGWKISDRIRTHVLTAENYFVQPKTYLVISADSLLRQKYNASFDLLTAVLPQLNNDGDMVVITDSLGVVIDSIVYTPSMGGTNGRSLERLYLDSSSTAPTNWSTSTAKANATPGGVNTASPKKYDLSLVSFAPAKTGFVESDSIIFILKIKNYGTETASGYGISLFNDANGDSLAQGSEFIKQVSISGGISSKDSVITEILTAPLVAGKYNFIAAINFFSDEDSLNNSSECAVTVYKTEVPAHDIVINEIMFEPASGNPEWIELQNISKDTVNLKNCTIGDVLSTAHTAVITTKDYFILPDDFVILSSDTLSSLYGYANSKLIKLSLPALNDDKDGIVLKSSIGATLDSVFYYSSWESKKGYSLERIDAAGSSCDSANWCFSYSPDKASPAKTNSVKGFAKLKTRGLLFNEILFNAGSKNSNFIELYNPADSAISLNGIVINIDRIYKVYLCDTAASIAAHGYYLIAEDSIITQKYPALKNFTAKNISATKLKLSKLGSSVSVTDAFGTLLDTVAYSSSWQSAGFSSSTDRSIEKKSPAAESNLSADWISCMSSEGATPGAENFSNKEVKLSGTGAEFKPNPFSPDNDGFEDFTVITLNAAFNPALVSITIYDNRGRKVRKLCDAMPVTIPAQITYDGMNDDKNPLRMGIYIALIEIQDMNSGRKETIKKAFVVARKLR